jgi:hypothetical protein
MSSTYAKCAVHVCFALITDVIREPVVDLSLSADWRTLDSMTGLASVKQKIRNLAEIVKTSLALELEGKPLRTVSLNRLFLGTSFYIVLLLYLTDCDCSSLHVFAAVAISRYCEDCTETNWLQC